jgi:DNA-binding GntR family transcriptional regulator
MKTLTGTPKRVATRIPKSRDARAIPDLLEPRSNTTDASFAYRKLRGLILRTELRPGQALNEADLMQRIEIGRTPLRDALHLLAHEGLVEILPRRGTFVTQVTVSDLQQIFELRSGIEDIVAHATTARLTDADFLQLRTLISRAKRATQAESDVELDAEFHSLLLRVAANRYLTEVYRRLEDASLRLLYLTNCGMEPPVDQRRFFEAAERALRSRNAEALSEVLRDHVRSFRDRVSGSLFDTNLRSRSVSVPPSRG